MSQSILQLVDSFDPVEFISNLKLWRGPKQEVEMYEPTDLKEVNLNQIMFDHFLTEKDGNSIKGEVKLDRAKNSNKILLGGRTFKTLWQDYQANGENSALEWWRNNQGIAWIDFPGIVLQSCHGPRCMLCLYYTGRGYDRFCKCWVWDWDSRWLDEDWDRRQCSAVLS